MNISEDCKTASWIPDYQWSNVYTNLSFSFGKHFLLVKVRRYQVGFLGICLAETNLEGPCVGKNCFAYSSKYNAYRYPQNNKVKYHNNNPLYDKDPLFKEGDEVGIFLDMDLKKMYYIVNKKLPKAGVSFFNLPSSKFHFYLSGANHDEYQIIKQSLWTPSHDPFVENQLKRKLDEN